MTTNESVGARGAATRARIDNQTASRAPALQVRVLVNSDTSGGRAALIETIAVPGAEPPCHRQLWADTLLYVVTGKLCVYLAGTWSAVPSQSAVCVPRGAEHTFAVLTPHARLLAVFAPAGFEQFYTELGPASWTAVEHSIAAAARCGCEITGPHPGTPPIHATD